MALNEAQKKERSDYLEKYLEITECSQKKPYVFISYASDNWETVFKTAIVPMQKKYGLSVYADKAFDKVNDKWIVPMLRNIRGADVVVAFVSQSYIESYACFLELLTAVNNRKQIVFVSLEERLHLGDTTAQPEVERGVKSEIMNQGANIATNTNNTSNDIMRAMKSAYTSLSTLLEQDALSKYDISDAFINFFRDASINRKTINDLNAVRGTIASVSERVFDKSLITEAPLPEEPRPVKRKPEPTPAPQPEPEPAPQPEPEPEPAPQPAEVQEAPAPEPKQPPVQTAEPEPPADFSWDQTEKPEEKGKNPLFGKGKKDQPADGKKKSKKPLIIGIAVAVVLFFILIGSGDTKEVTDQPYDMTDGSGAVFSGVYTGEWSKRNEWPNGEGVFALADDAGTYTGQWVDGVAQGQGSITWPSGASYEGEWLAGMRTGQGTMHYDDETVYVGEFKENKREGQGRRTWPDGGYVDGEWKNNMVNGKAINYIGGDENNPEASIYEGEYVDGKWDGYGTYTWPSGQKYEGEWKEGKYNGHGKLTYSNDTVFEGTFVDGKKDGDGTYTLTDGTVINEKWDHGAKYVENKEYTLPDGEAGAYTGFWDVTNKYPTGRGVMQFANGDVYEGDFAEGTMAGQGKMTYEDKDVYEGAWENGVINGQGTKTYANGNFRSGEWKDGKFNKGTAELDLDEGKYSGDWVYGKQDGQGKMVYKNGDVYEGTWVKGVINGEGTKTFANGNVRTGEWKDGEFVKGTVELTLTEGRKYSGEWSDGKANGQGTLTRADGTTLTGQWKDGNHVE